MIKTGKIGISYVINSIKDLFSSSESKGEETSAVSSSTSVKNRCEKLKVLRKTLESYGGLLAKVSQMLSYGIKDENVFDDLKPYSREKTHKFLLHLIKTQNLDYDIHPEIYKSGSIGQVYIGTYKEKKLQ